MFNYLPELVADIIAIAFVIFTTFGRQLSKRWRYLNFGENLVKTYIYDVMNLYLMHVGSGMEKSKE